MTRSISKICVIHSHVEKQYAHGAATSTQRRAEPPQRVLGRGARAAVHVAGRERRAERVLAGVAGGGVDQQVERRVGRELDVLQRARAAVVERHAVIYEALVLRAHALARPRCAA